MLKLFLELRFSFEESTLLITHTWELKSIKLVEELRGKGLEFIVGPVKPDVNMRVLERSASIKLSRGSSNMSQDSMGLIDGTLWGLKGRDLCVRVEVTNLVLKLSKSVEF